MKPTWWQRFWRWTVTLELIVYAVARFEFFEAQRAAAAMHLTGLGQVTPLLSNFGLGLVWISTALIAHIVLLVCVPILVVVELVAWWVRAEKRRADWKEMRRSATHQEHQGKYGRGA